MTSQMFAGTAAPSHGRARLAAVAAVGAVLVGAGVAGVALLSEGTLTRRGFAPALLTTVSDAPLELISLTHRRDGDSLVISGLVRNPGRGHQLHDLAAVVFLFDSAGGFLASGRAPLERPALVPGDASPFSVTLDHSGTVGRYRVSFRMADRVVPHIDRRGQEAVARLGR